MSERTTVTGRTADPERSGTATPTTDTRAAEAVPYADCVQCGEPTEYPETTRGATLCPVCEWQEGQRLACSG
jgi:hypothetical protein